MTEDQLSAQIFQYTWNTYHQLRRCFFHVMNEGKKTMYQANRDKSLGVVAGIPDYVLIYDSKVYGFELKTETGILSKSQKEVHAAWKNQNVPVYIVRSLEEFKSRLESILLNKSIEVNY